MKTMETELKVKKEWLSILYANTSNHANREYVKTLSQKYWNLNDEDTLPIGERMYEIIKEYHQRKEWSRPLENESDNTFIRMLKSDECDLSIGIQPFLELSLKMKIAHYVKEKSFELIDPTVLIPTIYHITEENRRYRVTEDSDNKNNLPFCFTSQVMANKVIEYFESELHILTEDNEIFF